MANHGMADAPEVVPATQNVPQDSKWSNFETVFTNAKAGMGGVNKEHVKRVVYEMSKVEITPAVFKTYTVFRPCS